MRTGRSGVLNTAHDFSCCILSAKNEFIVADESLPVHVLSGPDLMCKSIDKFHPVKKKGDAFLINLLIMVAHMQLTIQLLYL